MTEEHTRTATGTFDVQTTPREADPDTDPLGQLRITKTWSGDIEGSGRGLMLAGGDPAQGTAGYVAIELVTGTLDGRQGTFALQQFGTMSAGEPRLVYEVVPGSGTGELTGLSGVLDLEMADGEHRYALHYVIG